MTTSKKVFQSMDGNTATAHAAYAFSEVSGIYPITPSSPMAEVVDAWASQGRKNLFDTTVKVVEMQSEGGAAGAVHGVLQGGAYASTYTASQGLLLMIPNLYKMAGELLPGVIHVAARALASRALNIFGDHSDIYACRQTGVPIICSHSVQECMDLSGVTHLSAIEALSPMIHFFDGFRTSHEIQKIEVMDYDYLKTLINFEKVEEFRKNALNPHSNAVTRGGAENDDIFFQGKEAQNVHYSKVADIVAKYMKEISTHTGRNYAPFTYYGAPDAERIIVAMGSVTETIKETIDALRLNGEKVGLIKVHLYRPFSTEYLKNALPKTVKKIAVLDRTKEMGSREPLYLDMLSALKNEDILIVGGRYGMGSKDTNPQHINGVFEELKKDSPKEEFTIGIKDDVTNLSLDTAPIELKPDYTSCLFYGLGSDGTVSANKGTIKIIGDNTDLYAQAYFAYDSKKAGGVTRSHLRFGPSPIQSTYYVTQADFISCSLDSYVFKYDMLSNLKQGGTFLLNTTFPASEIEKHLPKKMLVQLANKNAEFYIIDATSIAQEIGMGRRTNTILQSAFFALNEQIIAYPQAVDYMKAMAKKSYSKKGEEVVKLNYKAIDEGKAGLNKIEVKAEWANVSVNETKVTTNDKYFDEHVAIINSLNGNDLPVSAFTKHNLLDGSIRNNVSFKEKRTIATQVPKWHSENCIQCGFCSYVCPHGTIRQFLLTDEEIKNAPQEFDTIQAMGKDVTELKYRIQVSPANCVGCELCVVECPGKAGNKALSMVDVNEEISNEPLADYLYNDIDYKSEYFPTTTVKGSQFLRPYFEVSGACPGCGETPYYKLVSQLYGKDMMVANATGCSSIYCGSTPSTPFTNDKNGEGVAWANSLFEDNAEYGFGMAVAQNVKEAKILQIIEENLDKVEPELKEAFNSYIAADGDREAQRLVKDKIITGVKNSKVEGVKELLDLERDLVGKSVWIVGGDGWAFDIGYGGLDHVLANELDVNVLVLDTEVYSNTGGQSSKASQAASIAKFAAGGKPTAKKDLGMIAMAYGHVYVAQIAMGANKNQTLKAIKEAEEYKGPSLIIAYSPCVEHGIKGGLKNHQKTQSAAVECGYLPLYRFDPRNENPLVVDSKEPNWDKFRDFLMAETRFSQLEKIKGTEAADKLYSKTLSDAQKRYSNLIKKLEK
ncbi:MAG: pyruvate:ferredoxin (flavodoxin) oxidoreductase [Anaerorhabdus sp.]